MADSLLSCDPAARLIQLRVGRVDATKAGPSGVPGPFDSLAVATAAFANAGFSRTDMIQAVYVLATKSQLTITDHMHSACGHSMGSVHEVDFPDIGTTHILLKDMLKTN
jgi:hypothetical protein